MTTLRVAGSPQVGTALDAGEAWMGPCSVGLSTSHRKIARVGRSILTVSCAQTRLSSHQLVYTDILMREAGQGLTLPVVKTRGLARACYARGVARRRAQTRRGSDAGACSERPVAPDPASRPPRGEAGLGHRR